MKSIHTFSFGRRPFIAALGAGIATGFRALADAAAPLFKVSLKEAHKGTLEIDTRLLDSYGAPPEPFRQFYLDARAIFAANPKADFTDAAIVKAAATHGLPVMGGPMLGNVTTEGATVWLRPATTTALTIQTKHTTTKAEQTFRAPAVEPGRETRIELRGLKADTAYEYAVMANNEPIATGGFTTAPPPADKGELRIAFGSCMHKVGVHNPNTVREILKRKPRAMLLLGDIAADDREGQINMHRADYQLRDVSTAWKQLASNVPVYAAWDDHDYFNNDLSGVPKRLTAADRDGVRGVWHQNWNNPPANDGREGIYFNTRTGPVEIIMLDTRSCRDNARQGERGSYLGERQMAWLTKTLRDSTAPFKVISSGTMWSDYVTKAKDSWGTWDPQAREEIFRLIEQENIGGVLLISGDRHGARGFKIPRPSGFDFLEFEAASLGGVPGPKGLVANCPEQLFGYDGLDFIAFGELTFDTRGAEPRVTFRLIDQTGAVLEEHAFGYDQLKPRT
ncbi:alkaline phosphatase [Pontiella sp.]|uniref:alkaline phosphatase D family protein n=1 Tax=Pontiella sp. TaxID=2837462 RepID=UPI003561BC68